VTHPRYFALFNPAPTFPAPCADRIAAVFNPQLATSTRSPAAVEIEAHVIRSVAVRAGLPAEAGGHFTTAGSEANYTALICALTRSNSGFATEGARCFQSPPVFYVSRESHLAWLKIAHQAGIGRSAVRLVATDGCGRMDANALAQTLSADLDRGCIPVMIAATAGTTNAGRIEHRILLCQTFDHTEFSRPIRGCSSDSFSGFSRRCIGDSGLCRMHDRDYYRIPGRLSKRSCRKFGG
jgi:aromatic-L-amino-acid/L-tryptophan decarboxylase